MKYVLTSLASITGIVVVLYLTVGREHLVPLVELAETPRPPVEVDRHSRAQLLSGLLDPPPAVEGADRNTQRRRRNELAREHAEALEQWRAGRVSLREVESIEEMLQVARLHTGEITEQELHERLAELFEREVERVVAMAKSGLAGPDQVDRARLYLARELHLAGRAPEDPRAAAYPEQRVAYLAAVKRRHEILVEGGLGTREHLQLEYEDLERDFPPPPAAKTK